MRDDVRALAGAGRHRRFTWLIAAVAALALLPALLPTSAGAATASWAFEPATYDFGTWMPGEKAPEPARLRLVNTGEVTLKPEFVVLIPNPDSSMQILYEGCDSPVSPGGGCTIEVAFKPQSPGPKEATLEIVSFAGGTTSAVAHLTGAGTAPTVSIDPTTVDFGAVALGTRVSPSRTITVTNPGSLDLSISEVQFRVLSGEAQPGFPPFASPVPNTCHSALVLPAGGSCTITMDFTPRVLGLASAELRLVDDALDSPQVIHLSGTGSPEAVPTPAPRPVEPQATLGRHPAKRTRSKVATFTFSGSPTTAGFVCRLDRQPFGPCTSPARYRSLKPGVHQFTVRATGSDGTQTPGATYSWRVLKPTPKHRPAGKHAK